MDDDFGESSGSRLRETAETTYRVGEQSLVRTQVYLSKKHRDYLNREATRRGQSMAELLRQWIDEKMNPNADNWESNPLLEETPSDPDFEGHEDASVRGDAYIYGAVSE